MPFLEYYEKAKKPIVKDRIMSLVRGVGIAVGQMHHFNVCHNDLKAGQVVLLGELRDDFRLIDFDNARRVGMMLPAGYTPMFAAPEVIRAHVTGTAATTPCAVKHDIWSFGMLAYWLFSGGNHFFSSPEEAQALLCDSSDSLDNTFYFLSSFEIQITHDVVSFDWQTNNKQSLLVLQTNLDMNMFSYLAPGALKGCL